jgi:hypothetical protein
MYRKGRAMITSAHDLLFSASAVRRILGLSASIAVCVKVWSRVVWVHVAGRRPTLISKQRFKHHFVGRRQAAAKALQVTRYAFDQQAFTVRNETKNSTYKVTAKAAVSCECDDYQNQLNFLGKGCCKHGYAVLNHLGFKSLADYVNARKVTPLRKVAEPVIPYAA